MMAASETESLAARAEAMLIRLVEARAEESSQQTRTEIENARARASKITADLHAAKDAIPELTECGVAVDLATPNSLLQEVARARTALRTAATSMVGAQPNEIASRVGSLTVDTALATAERLARSALLGLIRSVERWRQENLPANIAERIVGYSGTSDLLIVRLKHIRGRLEQKVENLDAGQLAQRARQIRDDAAAWAQERPKLDGGRQGRHPDIQRFLLSAATDDTDEGASWDLITPVVAKWLQDHENTANLRVVVLRS
jgi:hypothetical protein